MTSCVFSILVYPLDPDVFLLGSSFDVKGLYIGVLCTTSSLPSFGVVHKWRHALFDSPSPNTTKTFVQSSQNHLSPPIPKSVTSFMDDPFMDEPESSFFNEGGSSSSFDKNWIITQSVLCQAQKVCGVSPSNGIIGAVTNLANDDD